MFKQVVVKPNKIYLAILLGVCFLFLLPIAGVSFYTAIDKGSNLLLIIAIMLFALIAITLYLDFSLPFKIIADENSISFKNQEYTLNQIKSLKLNTKKLRLTRQAEVIEIVFDDGKKLILPYYFYQNLKDLNLLLYQVVQREEHFTPIEIKPISKQETFNEKRTEYKGNYLFNFNNGLMLFILGLSTSLFPKTLFPLSIILILPIFIIVFFYGINGQQSYYLVFSQQYLIIKNLYFPWYFKAYRIQDIQEVIFERGAPNNVNNQIGIVLKDFSYTHFYTYYNRKSFEKIRTELAQRNITLRDEIYEKT
ncbi:hypothetical protein EDM00_06175 [Ornithobacterium rhinotracheale]|uniref:hypothetical protein n=1 Tax=Ornithobacterium rhinotracheale TaxID=28251 RepID=UPI00129C9C27|nr:hypothetical protein [Ornithobacterium rhinotracheale]MRI63577.1 hypothetical protein [Ornithobacterium rhinotracheale]